MRILLFLFKTVLKRLKQTRVKYHVIPSRKNIPSLDLRDFSKIQGKRLETLDHFFKLHLSISIRSICSQRHVLIVSLY